MSGFILITDAEGDVQVTAVAHIVKIGRTTANDIVVSLIRGENFAIKPDEFARVLKILTRRA